jgi:hypothetical protein
MAMCRVKNLWRVVSDPQGFFIITVSNDRVWASTEGEIIQAYVLAKEKIDTETKRRDGRREDDETPPI